MHNLIYQSSFWDDVLALLQNNNFQAILIIIISIIVALIVKLIGKRVNFSKEEGEGLKNIGEKLITSIEVIIIIVGIYYGLLQFDFFSAPETQLVIKNIFYIIAILMATSILGRSVNYTLSRVQRLEESAKKIMGRTLKFLIYLIAILMILGQMSVDITPLLTTFGITGIAIGFAIQQPLANFFAGFQIFTQNPFKIGDYIEIDAIGGHVMDIGWFYTKIRKSDNNLYVLPNSKIIATQINNKTALKKQIWFSVALSVAQDSDLEKVEQVTNEVGKSIMETIKGGVPEYDPQMRFTAIGDFTYNITIGLMGQRYEDRFLLTHEFIKAIRKRYEAENIDMPFPTSTVHLKQ